MPRIVTDADLQNWEAYPSGGPFGLPEQPKIVFNCVSDPSRRPRWVRLNGDNADAERFLDEMENAQLQRLLGESAELR